MTATEKVLIATCSVVGWALGLWFVIRHALTAGRPSLILTPELIEGV